MQFSLALSDDYSPAYTDSEDRVDFSQPCLFVIEPEWTSLRPHVRTSLNFLSNLSL
jgi:hypothetical protein